MTRHMGFNSLIFSTVLASVLFIAAALFATPAQAMPIQEAQVGSATPTVLAYNWGPRYTYRFGWWGGRRYIDVCRRVCWRDHWGYLHCVHRC